MELRQIGANCNTSNLSQDWKDYVEICNCCGSSLILEPTDEVRHIRLERMNKGITAIVSDIPSTETTDEFWTDSIPIGDKFLVIKHRAVGLAEDLDEEDDE